MNLSGIILVIPAEKMDEVLLNVCACYTIEKLPVVVSGRNTHETKLGLEASKRGNEPLDPCCGSGCTFWCDCVDGGSKELPAKSFEVRAGHTLAGGLNIIQKTPTQGGLLEELSGPFFTPGGEVLGLRVVFQHFTKSIQALVWGVVRKSERRHTRWENWLELTHAEIAGIVPGNEAGNDVHCPAIRDVALCYKGVDNPATLRRAQVSFSGSLQDLLEGVAKEMLVVGKCKCNWGRFNRMVGPLVVVELVVDGI